ncbi:MAG: hypothetical protein H7270_11705 [Dermatophilaceae bacterium]|nr:hypothetical protein [Dermatophilaceae bacterium]
MNATGQPVVTTGPDGDLSTLQTPCPHASEPGSGVTATADSHLAEMGAAGGHSGGLPDTPWVPSSTPVRPLTGSAAQVGGFAVEDTTTIPKNWSWIVGQLNWAHQQLGTIPINPSWFSDNMKGGTPGYNTAIAAEPGLTDVYRYDGLHGTQVNPSSPTNAGLPLDSTTGGSMYSVSTTDPSRACAAYTDYGSVQPARIFVPQLPEGTYVPAVWPQMSATEKAQFITKQVHHRNSFASPALDQFYNQSWAAIEQLFQAAISCANHLEQGTTVAFTKGYGPQDAEVESSWRESQGALAQLEGSILQQQDNRLATQMNNQARHLAQATTPLGPNG